jgi:SAM-dependent methyltransferase
VVQRATHVAGRTDRPQRVTSGIDWAAQSGDSWTRRWRETDRGLAELGSKLDSALLEAAPSGPVRAMDIGCGPGTTSRHLARARPDATIIACDISPSLTRLAGERLGEFGGVRVVLGDAEEVAAKEGPFDLIFSRHGVMFFDDPVRAFRAFRAAAAPGATLIFSCFQDWESNAWASELSVAAAGHPLPAPGKEPSGFAFADPEYVRQILFSAGWLDADAQSISFRYVAGEGEAAVERAIDYLAEIGPAARTILELPEEERSGALARMRGVIENRWDGGKVEFAAAAWIWRAKAD